MKVNSCQENWDKMSERAQGRYCDVCNLTVFNLKDKSLEEIEDLHESEGKICGRINSMQVSEFQYLHPMKRFAIALFLVFGTGLFTTSYAQVLTENSTIETQSKVHHIKFRAENKDGTPLAGVYISFDTFDDYKEGTTDQQGELTLSYASVQDRDELYVNISYNDFFAGVQFKVSGDKINNFERIVFDPDQRTLTIGSSVFYEEFIIGDIAPVEWEEDPYEQKTEHN